MNRLIAVLNFGFSLVAAAVAIIVAFFLPEAWQGRAAEPEDFLLLLVWLVMMLTAGSAALGAGWALLRTGRIRGASVTALFFACLALFLAFSALAVLGVAQQTPRDPSWLLMLIPLTLFGVNAYRLAQLRRQAA